MLKLEGQLGFPCLEVGKPGIAAKRAGKYEKNKSSLVPSLPQTVTSSAFLGRVMDLNSSLQPGLLASLYYAQAERRGEPTAASLQLIYRDTEIRDRQG